MSRRTRARNAFETTISGSITDASTTIACTSLTGLDDPCYLVLEPDVPAKREYIKAATISGSNLQSVTRGLDGSTAGAQAHDAGAVVRSIPMHQQLDDTFSDIEDVEADITAHVGIGGAQHAAATTSLAGFMSGADKTKLDTLLSGGTVTGGNAHDHVGGDGAQIDHGGLAGLTDDDHAMYLKEKASGGTAAEVPEHDHLNAAAGGVLNTTVVATQAELDASTAAAATALTDHDAIWNAHTLPYAQNQGKTSTGDAISTTEVVENTVNITIPAAWASYDLWASMTVDVYESGTLTAARTLTVRIRKTNASGTVLGQSAISLDNANAGGGQVRTNIACVGALSGETATGTIPIVMTTQLGGDSGQASWDNFAMVVTAWRNS